MTNYVAKFSDGFVKEIKDSKKNYAAAYRITVKWKPNEPRTAVDADGYALTSYAGFSRDRALAAKAAMSESTVVRRGTNFRGSYKISHGPGEIVFNEIVDVVAS